MSATSETLRTIRSFEVEMARRIERAQEEEAAALAATGTEAERLVAEAQERGRAEAQRRFDERVAAARREAEQIAERAKAAVQALRGEAARDVAAAVDAAVALLLSPPGERGK